MRKILKNVLFVVLIIIGCQINESDNTAKLVSVQELLNFIPGYEWFSYEYHKYQPLDSVVNSIDSLWKIKRYKYLLFSNPSCNCEGTQAIFPAVVKILKSSNVPDSLIIIYSMLNETYQHPFKDKFKIKKLPSCFIEIDTSNYFSVIDTFELYRYKYPAKYKLEHIILLGLTK